MAQIKAILAEKSGVANAETTDNKVTSLSSSSTDTQYPSAKAAYDALAEKASKPYQTNITLSSTWSGSDPYTQTITVEDATENSRVDLHPNASALTQLTDDGVSALYVENKNGIFTANALGGPPSTSIKVLATVTEVEPYVSPNPAEDLNVGDTFQLGRYQVESETATPITWRVVHQTSTRSICMPTSILDLRCFDAKEPSNSDSNRKNYGNNKIGQANLIQWLNSSAAAGSWYTAQHTADQAPSNSYESTGTNGYDTKAGFLNLWTADEIALLQDVTLTLVNNTVTDGGGTYTKTVKVWCPTRYEMGLGNEASGVNDGGGFGAFSYFTDNNSRIMKISAACAANNPYSKSQSHTTSTAWYYWLGTPRAGNSHSVRLVDTVGSLAHDNACSGDDGVVPCIALER